MRSWNLRLGATGCFGCRSTAKKIVHAAQIPVFVGDRHVSHSPDYRHSLRASRKTRRRSNKLQQAEPGLYFQVFCKERMPLGLRQGLSKAHSTACALLRNSEKLLADLFIPLADAIHADGEKAGAFRPEALFGAFEVLQWFVLLCFVGLFPFRIGCTRLSSHVEGQTVRAQAH